MSGAKKQDETQRDRYPSAPSAANGNEPSSVPSSSSSTSSSSIEKNKTHFVDARLNLLHLLKFMGIGVVVGVAYIDPGNWGTDIAAGSKFGYSLL